jgi:hypothetical protein
MVGRPLRAGELLPAAALDVRPPAAIVSIPVKVENAPAVARGQLVDVWSTTKGCAPVRVLAGAAVQDVRASGGGALSVSTGSVQVVVRVRQDQAERVVAALGAEATIRLLVLDGLGPAHQRAGAPVDGCLAAGAADQPGGFRSSGRTGDLAGAAAGASRVPGARAGAAAGAAGRGLGHQRLRGVPPRSRG